MYQLYYTNRAKKDAQLIKASYLKDKAAELLALISTDPLAYPPEFEFLKGDLKGAISRFAKTCKERMMTTYAVLNGDALVNC